MQKDLKRLPLDTVHMPKVAQQRQVEITLILKEPILSLKDLDLTQKVVQHKLLERRPTRKVVKLLHIMIILMRRGLRPLRVVYCMLLK